METVCIGPWIEVFVDFDVLIVKNIFLFIMIIIGGGQSQSTTFSILQNSCFPWLMSPFKCNAQGLCSLAIAILLDFSTIQILGLIYLKFETLEIYYI
jgi:hypothetical protein